MVLTTPETLAYLESNIRPIIAHLASPPTVVKLYSKGRQRFLYKLTSCPAPESVLPPPQLGRKLWGIEFASPLFNAAGMFKNGEGYDLCHSQGAGAYLAGTTTANPRKGNEKNNIPLPFVPYPSSHAASNWLGLPNDGDEVIADRISRIKKHPGCPLGVSVMGSPDFEARTKLAKLIEGMKRYLAAGADFIEINESCPNTAHGALQGEGLPERLEAIKAQVLDQRTRTLPVIVKFSNDTAPEQVAYILTLLMKLGYDGVNFGNSSTAYDKYLSQIAPAEQKLYSFFTQTFGGGLTGRPLKDSSLRLVRDCSDFLAKEKPSREFHVIRTGGVETANDVAASLAAGASLVQWFTGYFETFARSGHKLYQRVYSELPPAQA